MEYKLETLKEKCEINFTATCEGEEWEKAQKKAINSLVNNVTVKGFRKGKAPVEVAAKQLSKIDILNKAADIKMGEAYKVMIEEKGVKPIAQPELDVKEFSETKIVFTFTSITQPTCELGEYKGLTITKKAVKVSKEDIQTELDRLVEQNSELVVAPIEYEAKKGDTVVIDFVGYIDGKAFDGGDAKGYSLELGSGAFIPGFEDKLIGIKTAEDKEIEIKFPENYVADLSNKDAKFKVHCNAVKQKQSPKVDDEFVKDLDIKDVETLDQLKEHLKGQITERKTQEAEQENVNTLIEKVVDNAKFTCSEKMVAEEAKRIVKDLTDRLEQNGLALDDYCKMTNKTQESIDKEAKEEASKEFKRAYVLDEIAKAEKIKVEAKDVDEKLEGIAKQYNTDVATLKKQLGNNISNFAYNLRQDKIIEMLKKENNL